MRRSDALAIWIVLLAGAAAVIAFWAYAFTMLVYQQTLLDEIAVLVGGSPQDENPFRLTPAVYIGVLSAGGVAAAGTLAFIARCWRVLLGAGQESVKNPERE